MNASSMYPTSTPTALTHVDRSVQKREYLKNRQVGSRRTYTEEQAFALLHSFNAVSAIMSLLPD